MAFVVRRAPYLVPEFILLPAKVRCPTGVAAGAVGEPHHPLLNPPGGEKPPKRSKLSQSRR